MKLRSCVLYVFHYVSRNKSCIEWMNKKIYPLVESKLGACDKQARLFAINVISEIAVNSVDPLLRSTAERGASYNLVFFSH